MMQEQKKIVSIKIAIFISAILLIMLVLSILTSKTDKITIPEMAEILCYAKGMDVKYVSYEVVRGSRNRLDVNSTSVYIDCIDLSTNNITDVFE
jgi:hypothetical protein